MEKKITAVNNKKYKQQPKRRAYQIHRLRTTQPQGDSHQHVALKKQQLIDSESAIFGSKLLNKLGNVPDFYSHAGDSFVPFQKYLHNLIYPNSPPVVTPLTPMKVFTKRIKFQDTLRVNANGHLCIVYQLDQIVNKASTSSVSPILYMNSTSYNPAVQAQAGLLGGWNIPIIQALRQEGTSIDSSRLSNLHVQFQITGVSALEKKGTIHLAETVVSDYTVGHVNDTVFQEAMLSHSSLSDLVLYNKYQSVEIMNMDSSSYLEYHYFPLSNRNIIEQYAPVTSSSTAGYYFNVTTNSPPLSKYFVLIIADAAPDTTIRCVYEFNIENEIKTPYINDYPPTYSRCFMDSEPYINLMNQDVDYTVRTGGHKSCNVGASLASGIRSLQSSLHKNDVVLSQNVQPYKNINQFPMHTDPNNWGPNPQF
jgi:hypothetical protein